MSEPYAEMKVEELAALAAERGIEAEKLEGSGAGGNVLKKDWVKALERLDRAEAKVKANWLPPARVEVFASSPEEAVSAGLEAIDELRENPEVAPEPEVARRRAAPDEVEAPLLLAQDRLERACYGETSPGDVTLEALMTKAADMIDWQRRQARR
jgi:pyruvate/2-oxoglutarate dehydrogenase complex dihydrolipoamide acyltransferase (E2) component